MSFYFWGILPNEFNVLHLPCAVQHA